MIVVISNEFPPRPGGAGHIASRLDCDYVISSKLTNYLCYEKKIYIAKWLWIIELPLRCLFKLNLFFASTTRIVINDFGGFISFLPFMPFTARNLVVIIHGLFSESQAIGPEIRTWIQRFILKFFDIKCFAVSKFLKNQLDGIGIQASYIHFGGILTNSIPKRTQDGPRDCIKFVLSCRINSKKLPVESLSFLDHFCKNLCSRGIVDIFGAFSDPKYSYLLMKCIKGLRYLTVNFNGYTDNDIVRKYMSEADYVVNTSLLKEAAPTIAYEAAMVNSSYIYIGGTGNDELGLYNSQNYLEISEFSYEEATRVCELLKGKNQNVQVVGTKPPDMEEIHRVLFQK